MKLTKIAIALVVVLAMSAVVASGASAKKLISNAGVNTASLEGVDTGKTHKFTVDGQSVTCENSTFKTGNINLPAETVTANAVYTGCTAFGFAGAKVDMGNCHYKITTPEKLEKDTYTSRVHVICKDTANSANNVINVNSSVFGSECSVSIAENNGPEGKGTNHILIHNTTTHTPRKIITLTITVSGITATKNKDNGLCPLSGTGVTNNAEYNGELNIEDVSATPQDIFLEE